MVNLLLNFLLRRNIRQAYNTLRLFFYRRLFRKYNCRGKAMVINKCNVLHVRLSHY